MSKRKRQRRRQPPSEWPAEKKRSLGLEAVVLWVVTLGFWARTARWYYNERILRRHDEMYAAVLLIDLLLPIFAIVITVEWWRGQRRQKL